MFLIGFVLLSILLYPYIHRGIIGASLEPVGNGENHPAHPDKASSFYDLGETAGRGYQHYLKRLDERYYSRWLIPVLLTAASVLLYPVLNWEHIDPQNRVRGFVCLISFILTWVSISEDYDLVLERKLVKERMVLLFAFIGTFFYPGFLVLLLFTAVNLFKAWYHHLHLVIRLLFFFLSMMTVYALYTIFGVFFKFEASIDFSTASLLLTLIIVASHYFVGGVCKLKLGPRWYSWIIENRIHYLIITGYMYGWLGFLPEKSVVSFANKVSRLDRLLQFSVVVVELGAVLILFDQWAAVALLALFTMFHFGVFIFSGAFFWHNILVTTYLAVLIYNIPEEISSSLFNLPNGVFAILVILLLPAKGKVWIPSDVGWWDIPYLTRIHWEVQGLSGKWYEIYNDFMRPYEKMFLLRYGSFLSKRKQVSCFLGETRDYKKFKDLQGAVKDVEKLEEVRVKYGKNVYDPTLEREHDRYMTTLLRNLNLGGKKNICPKWLRAPLGMIFYWGKLPRYTGQEAVSNLRVVLREEIFDDAEIQVVHEEVIKTLYIQ